MAMETKETEEQGRVWPWALETEKLMEAGKLRTASKDRETEDAGKRGDRCGVQCLGAPVEMGHRAHLKS